MKRFFSTLGAIALMVGLLATLPSVAFAENSQSASQEDGNVDFELHLTAADADSADSHFDYVSKSIHKSAVNDHGQTVLTPVNKPSAHWVLKNARKCPTVNQYPTKRQIKNFQPTTFILKGAALKQFKKAAMSEKKIKDLNHGNVKMSAVCFQLPDGEHFPDTGLALNGDVRGWDNVVHGSPMLFEIAKVTAHRPGESTDAYVPIRRGQVDNHGIYSRGDCGNKKAAVVEFGNDEVEYNDSDSYWWKDSGDVLARVRIFGTGTISEGNCSLTINYDFFAQGSASYDAIVKGKTSTEAHGESIKVIDKQSAHVDASANAEASVRVDLTANFEGCDNPPSETPSSIVEMEQPNDVLVNNTRTIRVRGVVPTGQTATLKMSADTGAIANGDQEIPVSESFNVLVHYTASSEPGSDTVTADLFSSIGHKDDTKSVTFQIRPAPIDPP